MKTIHYIQATLGALAVGLPQLAYSYPPGAAPYFTAAAGTCALAVTVLGIVSPAAQFGGDEK